MASPEFDFPDPFGPVMAVKPDWKGIVTSPNDLKLSTSIFMSLISSTMKRFFSPPQVGVRVE